MSQFVTSNTNTSLHALIKWQCITLMQLKQQLGILYMHNMICYLKLLAPILENDNVLH